MPATVVPSELRLRAMGCDVHVLVVGGPPDLVELARDRVEELERRWSRFRPESEISRLNLPAAPGARLEAAWELAGCRWPGGCSSGGRAAPTSRL